MSNEQDQPLSIPTRVILRVDDNQIKTVEIHGPVEIVMITGRIEKRHRLKHLQKLVWGEPFHLVDFSALQQANK